MTECPKHDVQTDDVNKTKNTALTSLVRVDTAITSIRRDWHLAIRDLFQYKALSTRNNFLSPRHCCIVLLPVDAPKIIGGWDIEGSGAELADLIRNDHDRAWERVLSNNRLGLAIITALGELARQDHDGHLKDDQKEGYSTFKGRYDKLVASIPRRGLGLRQEVSDGMLVSLLMSYWRVVSEDMKRPTNPEFAVIREQLAEIGETTDSASIRKISAYNSIQIQELEQYMEDASRKLVNELVVIAEEITSDQVIQAIVKKIPKDKLIEVLGAILGLNPNAAGILRTLVIEKLEPQINEWIKELKEEMK